MQVAQVTVSSQINTKHINTVQTEYTIVEMLNLLVHHVILIAFPLQQWLKERTSVLRYTLCPFVIHLSPSLGSQLQLHYNYLNIQSSLLSLPILQQRPVFSCKFNISRLLENSLPTHYMKIYLGQNELLVFFEIFFSLSA